MFKKLKNFWVIFLIACIILVGVLTLGVSAEVTKITWWCPNWDEPVGKEMIAEFEKNNPNIKVNMVVTTWDTMEAKIRVSIMGKNAPEVITDLESRIVPYAKKGYLEKLDGYIEKENIDIKDFLEPALAIGTYENGIYSLPFRHDGSGMYYNKKMFREAGLDPEKFPTTWTELIDAGKKLTKDTDGDGKIDIYGMAWPLGIQSSAVCRYIRFLFTYGGILFDKDEKKSLLNSDASVLGLKYIADSINVDKFAPMSSLELDCTKERILFVGEKIAFYESGPFDIDVILEENPNLDFGTAVIPGEKGMAVTAANGFSLMMPKNSKNKDAGFKLIEYLTRTENQIRLTLSFPARKSAIANEKYQTTYLAPFAKQLELSMPESSHTKWPEIEKIIYNHMQLVVAQKETAKEAAEKMANEVDQIL